MFGINRRSGNENFGYVHVRVLHVDGYTSFVRRLYTFERGTLLTYTNRFDFFFHINSSSPEGEGHY